MNQHRKVYIIVIVTAFICLVSCDSKELLVRLVGTRKISVGYYNASKGRA